MKKVFLYTDGACKGNPGPASIGIIIKDSNGQILTSHNAQIGHSNSNIAEYLALLEGIKLAKRHGATDIEATTDSQVLERHLNGQYNIQQPQLIQLASQIKSEIHPLDYFHIKHVRRHFNREADRQANLAFIRDKNIEQVEASLDSWS